MQKHPEISRQRLQLFASERGLRGRIYPQRAPVSLSVYSAADRIPYAEALSGGFHLTQVGEVFGPAWSTHWFKVDILIPSEWAGQEVHFLWDSSSEACVWRDGQPVQGLTGSGPSFNERRPIRSAYRLAASARGGERICLYVEMACNTLFGIDPLNIFPLKQAEIAVFDHEAWDLLWDFVIIADMAQHLPANTPRAGQALYAANRMVNMCNLDDRNTWPRAREIVIEFFSDHNGDSQHQISAIGHAHIDTAWLWPLAETQRKCYRTFSTALRLMDDYPNYKFACSQAQQYAWMKESQPALYQQMTERVKDGRFVPVGGTWVEPDCNLTSGESLVRQFLHGQRFFQQEFGLTCNEFWSPDAFGYSAVLPQILRGVGIQYFITQKLSWNQFNKPTNHTFLWEGLDGSRVLAHFLPVDTYNAMADVRDVLHNVSNFKEHERARESLMEFGYGDGGCGPTPEMLEQLQRMGDIDGLPRVQIRSPQEFYRRCVADLKDPVTWVGEFYNEFHRGTYTNQARNKRFNRKSEFLLHNIEFVSALAHALQKSAYPDLELDRLWKLVLLNQFHDIIPGSSITQVYAESATQYEDILNSGTELLDQSLAVLLGRQGTKHIAAINTLSAARTEVVELPVDIPTSQKAAGGKSLAVISAPGLGYTILTHRQLNNGASLEPTRVSETTDTLVLENGYIQAVFQRDGRLISLVDKSIQREAIEPGKAANNFVLFDDEPLGNDAWDVDIFHLEKRYEVGAAKSSRIIEVGPLRAAIEFEYTLGNHSQLKQVVSLTCVSARLDFATEVDWHEHRRFLKVEFPLNIHSDYATYEIQFGHIRRSTHFNTSFDLARFEVWAHRWADLSEPGFGVALLNDCKYGYSTQKNVMRLSLLRSVSYPPDPVADMGQQQFRYALLPHSRSFYEAGVIEEGFRFNVPLLVSTSDHGSAEATFFSVDRPAVVIDTVKKAEDSNALIVRIYEAHGSRGPVRFSSPLPVTAVSRCNLSEEDEIPMTWSDGGVNLEILPFQIVTLKLQLA
jgi:alpha-mannosidase